MARNAQLEESQVDKHGVGSAVVLGSHQRLDVSEAVGERKAQRRSAAHIQRDLLEIGVAQHAQRQRPRLHLLPKQLRGSCPEDVLQVTTCVQR